MGIGKTGNSMHINDLQNSNRRQAAQCKPGKVCGQFTKPYGLHTGTWKAALRLSISRAGMSQTKHCKAG